MDPDGKQVDFPKSLSGVFKRFKNNQTMLIDPEHVQPGLSAEKALRVAELAEEIRGLTGPAPESTDGESTRSIQDPSSFEGATYDDVVEAIPDGWEAQPAKTDDGVRYRNPERSGETVRIMRGNPTASDEVRRGPYVKISNPSAPEGQKKGAHIPLAGNPTLDRENRQSQ